MLSPTSVARKWPRLSLRMFTVYSSRRQSITRSDRIRLDLGAVFVLTRLSRLGSYLSRVSGTFVKKKAALTLLRMYRKHPDVVPSGEWAERIVSIMDDEDLVGIRSLESSSPVNHP